MPKILALQGSPRKHGKVAQLLQAACDGAREAGAEIQVIHLYDLNFSPCTGCMACRASGQCIKRDDDVGALEAALLAAEGLMMASPTYWGNMSGVMKLAMERLSGFLLEEPKNGFPRPRLGKNRGKALLIATCSTPWPFSSICNQSRATLSRMAEIAHWSGFKITGRVALSGTQGMPEVPMKILSKARKMGRKLV